MWLWKPIDCGIEIQGGGGALTICPGTEIELSVIASGAGPFTYQWRRDGLDLMDGPSGTGSVVAGSASATLIVSPASPGDAGSYECAVSNTCGSELSVATLASICYADCTCDGTLDFFDFLCFQNAFASGEPSSDCDASGTLDFFDFLCFQNGFNAGCP